MGHLKFIQGTYIAPLRDDLATPTIKISFQMLVKGVGHAESL